MLTDFGQDHIQPAGYLSAFSVKYGVYVLPVHRPAEYAEVIIARNPAAERARESEDALEPPAELFGEDAYGFCVEVEGECRSVKRVGENVACVVDERDDVEYWRKDYLFLVLEKILEDLRKART